MNEIAFASILSSLLTLLVVSITRDIKRKTNCNIKEHKYNIGDKIIYRQSNCSIDRLVGCEIMQLRRHKKDKTPYYKVKAYTEDLAIWYLSEEEIECTEGEFGEFPNYNNKKRGL